MQVLLLGLVPPRPPLLRRSGCAAGYDVITATGTATGCYNLRVARFRDTRVSNNGPNRSAGARLAQGA